MDQSGGELALNSAVVIAVGRPIAQSASRLLEALLGRPFRVAGDLLGDEIYFRQCLNRIRIAARTKQRLDEAGVSPRILPLGFLTSFFDAAGNVDAEDMQDVWARLLENANADPQHANQGFVEVLRRLSPDAARAFHRLGQAELLSDPEAITAIAADLKAMEPELEARSGAYWVELAILESCGLIHYRGVIGVARSMPHPHSALLKDFGLTLFGEMLFCALHGLDPKSFGARRATAMSCVVETKPPATRAAQTTHD